MGTLSVELRPQAFEEVIGNETVVQSIKKQFDTRPPRAVMLFGGPGFGKTTLARIIASYVKSSDITEINAADTNGVEDARRLADNSQFCSLSSGPRVVILDEAQRLSVEAQNVLLKPFEEKHSQTLWIICTTDPQKLIKPLKDRCLSYELKGLSNEDILNLIQRAFVVSGRAGLNDNHVDVYNAIINTYASASPREILMAVDRYLSGVPAAQAVQSSESEQPEYIAIARSTHAGSWPEVSRMLKKMKPQDSLGIRAVTVNYLASVLRSTPAGGYADKLAECIRALFSYPQGFQDGSTRAATEAWLYGCCKRLGEKAFGEGHATR